MNLYRWILINIGLPLTPFIIRYFVMIIGSSNSYNNLSIANFPEVLFFSIYMCVVNLNINIDKKKGLFEYTVRIFMYLIIFANCITIGMIYSNNIGVNISYYLYVVSIVPTLIAPLYKIKYRRL